MNERNMVMTAEQLNLFPSMFNRLLSLYAAYLWTAILAVMHRGEDFRERVEEMLAALITSPEYGRSMVDPRFLLEGADETFYALFGEKLKRAGAKAHVYPALGQAMAHARLASCPGDGEIEALMFGLDGEPMTVYRYLEFGRDETARQLRESGGRALRQLAYTIRNTRNQIEHNHRFVENLTVDQAVEHLQDFDRLAALLPEGDPARLEQASSTLAGYTAALRRADGESES